MMPFPRQRLAIYYVEASIAIFVTDIAMACLWQSLYGPHVAPSMWQGTPDDGLLGYLNLGLFIAGIVAMAISRNWRRSPIICVVVFGNLLIPLLTVGGC